VEGVIAGFFMGIFRPEAAHRCAVSDSLCLVLIHIGGHGDGLKACTAIGLSLGAGTLETMF
jgi:hypothetical protein